MEIKRIIGIVLLLSYLYEIYAINVNIKCTNLVVFIYI